MYLCGGGVYECIYIYICMYLYIAAFLYVCVYVCVYVHTHIHMCVCHGIATHHPINISFENHRTVKPVNLL